MYSIRILDEASRDLLRLDKSVGVRIVERLRWLAENLENVKPEALISDLVGFYKLRVGDYRVIYDVLRDEQTIVIYSVGHRRDIYHKQ
jgi:mRNA interferase RelE/StbE